MIDNVQEQSWGNVSDSIMNFLCSSPKLLQVTFRREIFRSFMAKIYKRQK